MSAERLHILALEAYDGGSHAAFLDGLIGHSRHRFTRLGLPARKWKWRMRGAALYFTEQLRGPGAAVAGLDSVSLILTSDMTAVADLRALLPAELARLPLVCYFHENQLTYPMLDESARDYQYGFTNITSTLASEAVWFNSQYHRDSFRRAVGELLARMPDFVPTTVLETLDRRATVMPLGLNPDLFVAPPPRPAARCPRILWNHRWEYDKNPEAFFEALHDLDRAGVDFEVILAGEQFRESPPIFAAAQAGLADHIIHVGYAPTRTEYVRLLDAADIVVSTTHHEFFGLAVLEAMARGCYPLLPQRLSYPELLPADSHEQHLYDTDEMLPERLAALCRAWPTACATDLAAHVRPLAWPTLAQRYDAAFDALTAEKDPL